GSHGRSLVPGMTVPGTVCGPDGVADPSTGHDRGLVPAARGSGHFAQVSTQPVVDAPTHLRGPAEPDVLLRQDDGQDRVIRRSIGWYWLGVVVESLLDVGGDQIVVVERDGGGGPGGRGVDQLGGVVHDVAGRPHAVDAGATGAIGGDPALVIEFAAQGGQQLVGRYEAWADEQRRASDHRTLGE